MDSLANTIGYRIKQARLDLGFSQTELADAINVSQPTVANWENCSHEPRQNALNKLAVALKTNPTWLKVGQTSGNGQAHSTQSYLRRPLHHVPIISWPSTDSLSDALSETAHDYIAISVDAAMPFALLANDPAMAAHFPIGVAIVFDGAALELIDGACYLFGLDGQIVLRRWQSEPARLEAQPNQSAVDAHFVDQPPAPIARAIMSVRRH